jgi:hypothetical protein
MAGCGCNNQSGGSKKCSCKRCSQYTQNGKEVTMESILNDISDMSVTPRLVSYKRGGRRKTRKTRKTRRSKKSKSKKYRR